jgi:hypothetical protein
MISMYTSEQKLVDEFLEKMIYNNPWKISKFSTEFNYSRGKTDIVAISFTNEVIAIEAKLSKWRYALHQAYRNRCFADRSYVLLPMQIAIIAIQHEEEFNKRGVGLCSIENDHITILREAITEKPIQPWLQQVALHYAMEG